MRRSRNTIFLHEAAQSFDFKPLSTYLVELINYVRLPRSRISHKNKKSSIVFNQQIEVEGVFGAAIHKWRHQFFRSFDPYLVRDTKPPIYFNQSRNFFNQIVIYFFEKDTASKSRVNCSAKFCNEITRPFLNLEDVLKCISQYH